MAAFTEERKSPCRSLQTVDMVAHLPHPPKPPMVSAEARRKRSRGSSERLIHQKGAALHPTDERERAGVCALASTQLKVASPSDRIVLS